MSTYRFSLAGAMFIGISIFFFAHAFDNRSYEGLWFVLAVIIFFYGLGKFKNKYTIQTGRFQTDIHTKSKRSIRDYNKLVGYYVRIYLESGNFTRDQAEKKIKDFIDHGAWAPEILGKGGIAFLADNGILNIGVCPKCGYSPIGKEDSWPYKWKYNFSSVRINVCEMCFNER